MGILLNVIGDVPCKSYPSILPCRTTSVMEPQAVKDWHRSWALQERQ